jgi:hypothetical protein
VIQPHDPPWTQTTVINALSSLSRLQDLQVTSICNRLLPIHLELDHLSGLKKISITADYTHFTPPTISGLARLIAKSPQLVHLEVNLGLCGMSQQAATLHELLRNVTEDCPLRLTHLVLDRMSVCVDSFTLPHLRSLVSLDLRNLCAPNEDDFNRGQEQTDASLTSDIYPILQREQIYPTQVIVSDIDNVVFDYLCSYSCLETLDLCSFCFNTPKESNDFAHKFYNFVLPILSNSIQVLKIQPMYEREWYYNPEDISQVAALSRCNKLRSLSVTFASIFLRGTTARWRIVSHDEKEYFYDAVCPSPDDFNHLVAISEELL